MSKGSLLLLMAAAGAVLTSVAATVTNRKHKRLHEKFEALAQVHQLQVGSTATFGLRIAGIDCMRRKILYVKMEQGRVQYMLIELDELINCSYRKVYLKTRFGKGNARNGLLLSEILLELDKKDLTTIAIPFYRRKTDSYTDTGVLEVKARRWEMLIQKLMASCHEAGTPL